jgi:predicted RNA-binding protein with PIN domain
MPTQVPEPGGAPPAPAWVDADQPRATGDPQPHAGQPSSGGAATKVTLAGAAVDPAEGGLREPVLPEPVRNRVIALAADALTGVASGELPPPLRRVARFTAHRRARLGGPLIATYLSTDPGLRERLAEEVLKAAGELGRAVQAGTPPAAAEPVEVAALAYLLRPPDWTDLVDAATHVLVHHGEQALLADAAVAVQAQLARLEHDRAMARTEADKLRDELGRMREEAAGLRVQNRELTRALREATAAQKRAADLLAIEKGRLARTINDHDAELRRLRVQLAELREVSEAGRQDATMSRQAADARLWLLLETIGQAATGLRRELGLSPTQLLPADLVARDQAAHDRAAGVDPHRGLAADDPIRLDHLLALPRAHLIVDGYNVTKSGFPDVPLEQQRSRLVRGLAGLTAQTGAEITAVFDGGTRPPAAPPTPRGVRVLFSRSGQSADDLIRALVRAEPAGRPVVVVSSDKEVADGVRRHGAYPLGAASLLRRLARS